MDTGFIYFITDKKYSKFKIGMTGKKSHIHRVRSVMTTSGSDGGTLEHVITVPNARAWEKKIRESLTSKGYGSAIVGEWHQDVHITSELVSEVIDLMNLVEAISVQNPYT